MNAQPSFVGVARTSAWGWVAVGSNGARNIVADVDSWKTLAEWDGPEVAGCCAVGGRLLCAERNGRLQVFEGDARWSIEHSSAGELRAGVQLSATEAMLGGPKGRLLIVDVVTKTVSYSSLGERGMVRPGRDIVSMSAVTDGTIVAGKNNLLLKWSNDRVVDLLSHWPAETTLFDSVESNGTVWAVGLAALKPVLVEVPSGGKVGMHSLPFQAKRSPTIARFGNDLLLVSESMIVGSPGKWREVGIQPEGSAIASIPKDKNTVLVVGYTGKSWLAQPYA